MKTIAIMNVLKRLLNGTLLGLLFSPLIIYVGLRNAVRVHLLKTKRPYKQQ